MHACIHVRLHKLLGPGSHYSFKSDIVNWATSPQCSRLQHSASHVSAIQLGKVPQFLVQIVPRMLMAAARVSAGMRRGGMMLHRVVCFGATFNLSLTLLLFWFFWKAVLHRLDYANRNPTP
jgi:hypothetical protein